MNATAPLLRAPVPTRPWIEGSGLSGQRTKPGAPRTARLVAGSRQQKTGKLPLPPVIGPGKPGILVVDDEDFIGRFLEVVLRKEGFAVWSATGGQQAVDLHRRHRKAIALVLLDVRMPHWD